MAITRTQAVYPTLPISPYISLKARLLLTLFFAQLMLTGIHFLKKNWITAAVVRGRYGRYTGDVREI